MIDRWIAEATACDFKVALEVKKPKSWLKSVSAFANGIGGTLFFGIDDDRNVVGLSDAQTDAETISRLMKERITPYPSFVLAPARENGKLTNAGALLADDSPIRHSRLFCTRWNGLDKSGGIVDALDSAEYSGSLIILLNEGVGFVKRNMKTRWKKTADSRIEMPDYCERSVFEALVNALIHRDYLILGSEVHIDIYDDRLTIYSPGGMPDGTRVQERDLSSISSTRRNPVLADLFGRLGYMERQGSGFKKITESYHAAHNYRSELEPQFYSDASSFQVTLYNLNYGLPIHETGLADEKQTSEREKTVLQNEKQAFESLLAGLTVSTPTKDHMLKLFRNFGFDTIFARADVMQVTGITATPATELMRKMKDAKLIVRAKGRGKYIFAMPTEGVKLYRIQNKRKRPAE